MLMDVLKYLPKGKTDFFSRYDQVPDDVRTAENIRSYFQRIKELKRRLETEDDAEMPSIKGCRHEEPTKVRRITGQGSRFVWRCGVCMAYLNPNWETISPLEANKSDVLP